MSTDGAPDLDLGGVVVAVSDFERFMAEDPRRGRSFISNFGTWHLRRLRHGR